MSGRLLLIGQNQPMLNSSNFGGPFELGPGAICPTCPPPLSAALTHGKFWAQHGKFWARHGKLAVSTPTNTEVLDTGTKF